MTMFSSAMRPRDRLASPALGSMSRDEDIFAEALQLPAAERGEFLRRSCANDEPGRARVDALLQGHDRASDFLRTPLSAIGSLLTAAAPLGRIGRYQLL